MFCFSRIVMNLDVQRLFKVVSKIFQSRHNSIIGNSARRTRLQEDLERLKVSEGEHMTDFLDNCHCFRLKKQAMNYVKRNIPLKQQTFNDKCHTLDRYEKNWVVYNNVLIHENTHTVSVANRPYKKLSLERKGYIDKIITNLNNLFPIDLLEEIDIFDQRWVEKNTK